MMHYKCTESLLWLVFLQIAELQRKEHDRKQLLEQAILMAEKVVNGRMSKQAYVDGENQNKSKRQKLSGEIEAIESCL